MRQARLDELELEPPLRKALASLFRRMDEDAWDKVDQIILYGSVARGESGPQSDVDLLVIWRGPEVEGMDRLGRPSTEVFLETGIDIAIQVVSPDDMNKIEQVNSSFYQNIARDGILIAA